MVLGRKSILLLNLLLLLFCFAARDAQQPSLAWCGGGFCEDLPYLNGASQTVQRQEKRLKVFGLRIGNIQHDLLACLVRLI